MAKYPSYRVNNTENKRRKLQQPDLNKNVSRWKTGGGKLEGGREETLGTLMDGERWNTGGGIGVGT